MSIYTCPEGFKWRQTSGYNGHLRGPDGRMHFDVHTGVGRRTVWVEVVPPATCDTCGNPLPGDFHAEQNHKRACQTA